MDYSNRGNRVATSLLDKTNGKGDVDLTAKNMNAEIADRQFITNKGRPLMMVDGRSIVSNRRRT